MRIIPDGTVMRMGYSSDPQATLRSVRPTAHPSSGGSLGVSFPESVFTPISRLLREPRARLLQPSLSFTAAAVCRQPPTSCAPSLSARWARRSDRVRVSAHRCSLDGCRCCLWVARGEALQRKSCARSLVVISFARCRWARRSCPTLCVCTARGDLSCSPGS